MRLDDCFELGYIVKPHGTKGEIHMILDVDDPEKYLEMESVFIAHGGDLIPFSISGLRASGKGLVVKFDGVNSFNEAEELRNKRVYLPLDVLPALEEGQFYYHDIINFTVHDKQEGQLGKVKEVFLKGSQDLIIMEYKGADVLIPVSDEIVLKADIEKGVLYVNLPEGLLAVYLS